MPRERRWSDPAVLEQELNAYFEQEESPTMAGLCVFLKIHKDTLSAYNLGEYDQPGENYSRHIKFARLRVEAHVESQLLGGRNQTGAIFWLKNNSDGAYKDVQHNENNHNVRAVITDEPLSEEEWEQQNG